MKECITFFPGMNALPPDGLPCCYSNSESVFQLVLICFTCPFNIPLLYWSLLTSSPLLTPRWHHPLRYSLLGHPTAIMVVSDDFNHATTDKTLPNCSTGEKRTLDLLYSNITDAKSSRPLPPLRCSYHYLVPQLLISVSGEEPACNHEDSEEIVKGDHWHTTMNE